MFSFFLGNLGMLSFLSESKLQARRIIAIYSAFRVVLAYVTLCQIPFDSDFLFVSSPSSLPVGKGKDKVDTRETRENKEASLSL